MIDIRHRSFEETLLACEALGGVDLIVTSPPYCDARTASAYGTAEASARPVASPATRSWAAGHRRSHA